MNRNIGATLAAALLLAACGPINALPPDSGNADAGPCDPLAQTGCGTGAKCTIRLDTGQPTCATAGTHAAYEACASDTDCAAGTVCIGLSPSAQFESAQVCRPFCNP